MDCYNKGAGNKTIYLIRHAESENNVSKGAFRESLGRRRPPSWAQARAMAPMLAFPMNTPLSQRGVRQVFKKRIPHSAFLTHLVGKLFATKSQKYFTNTCKL